MLKLFIYCVMFVIRRSQIRSRLFIYAFITTMLFSCVTKSIRCNENSPMTGHSLINDNDRVDGNIAEQLDESVVEADNDESTSFALYRHLLRDKRRSHKDAVKTILNMEKYEKRYSVIKLMLEKIFSTTTKAKVVLMESGYTPGDLFPTDENLREVLSMVMENTVFFGDLLLHQPDIVHDLLRRNKEWNLMAHWGISFTNGTRIYEAHDLKLLHLMAQEMDIIERDPDYTNPYKAPERDLQKEIERLVKQSNNVAEAHQNTKQKKRKEKKKKKGPRLSNLPHSEL